MCVVLGNAAHCSLPSGNKSLLLELRRACLLETPKENVGSEPSLQSWMAAGAVHLLLLILEPSCPRGRAEMSLGCLARRCPSEVRLFMHLMLMPRPLLLRSSLRPPFALFL